MEQCFRNALVIGAGTYMLVACQAASQQAASPTPETEQVVSDAMKELYMEVSMAPPQSAMQQQMIVKMAKKASNAKELLLVKRAADGVFPAGTAATGTEHEVQATVTGKMIRCGTLEQLLDYAAGYPAEAGDARALVERMLELGKGSADPRVWYQIRAVAFHLRQKDLERQAQATGDRLAAQ